MRGRVGLLEIAPRVALGRRTWQTRGLSGAAAPARRAPVGTGDGVVPAKAAGTTKMRPTPLQKAAEGISSSGSTVDRARAQRLGRVHSRLLHAHVAQG